MITESGTKDANHNNNSTGLHDLSICVCVCVNSVILTTSPCARFSYFLHFTDEETKAHIS